jgi:hypothetical protein
MDVLGTILLAAGGVILLGVFFYWILKPTDNKTWNDELNKHIIPEQSIAIKDSHNWLMEAYEIKQR